MAMAYKLFTWGFLEYRIIKETPVTNSRGLCFCYSLSAVGRHYRGYSALFSRFLITAAIKYAPATEIVSFAR